MVEQEAQQLVAFVGSKRIAEGPMVEVGLAVKRVADLPGGEPIVVFDSGGAVDLTGSDLPVSVPITLREGTGTANQQSAWSTNISNMDELPAVAIRVVFTANLLQPQDLPYLDGIAFTFQLK